MKGFALGVVLALALLRSAAAAAAPCDYECVPEPAQSLPDDELMSWSGDAAAGLTLAPSTDCSDQRLTSVYATAVGSCDLPAVAPDGRSRHRHPADLRARHQRRSACANPGGGQPA